MYTEVVEVIRTPTRTDSGGNEVPDLDAEPEPVGSIVCSMQPVSTSEVVAGTGSQGDRAVVYTGWRLYSKPGQDIDVRSSDLLRWRGMLLDVQGDVMVWPHPIRPGAVHHVEIVLARVA